MPDIQIDQWDFESGFAYGSVDGKAITIPFRTAEDGGKRPEEEVEDGAMPCWEWDGDEDAPTLSPSIRMFDAHFHIRDGEVQETGT